MHKNGINNIVVKEYFVIVSEKGEYLRLNKNLNKIKIAERTYQALKGSRAEMLKVYGNLLSAINGFEIEVPYDDFKLGGILLIRETVTNDEWITPSEINEFLEQINVKEGYEVSGQRIISKSLNKVETYHNSLIVSDDEILEILDSINDELEIFYKCSNLNCCGNPDNCTTDSELTIFIEDSGNDFDDSSDDFFEDCDFNGNAFLA